MALAYFQRTYSRHQEPCRHHSWATSVRRALWSIFVVILLTCSIGCSSKPNPVLMKIYSSHLGTGIRPAAVVSDQFPEADRQIYREQRNKELNDANIELERYYRSILDTEKNDKDRFYEILRKDDFECANYIDLSICKMIFPRWGYSLFLDPPEDIENATSTEFIIEFITQDEIVMSLKTYVFDLAIRNGEISP